MTYPKEQYCVHHDKSVLQCNRVSAKPNLPGNVIIIHGVNDVGVSYAAVEEGLCHGLDTRLYHVAHGEAILYTSGTYRMPTEKDKDVLEPDPDAVFFKRKFNEKTHSPVIPFYWGFRETTADAKRVNGQRTDRHGNRLDKDLSKGGGPFSNATSTLPDMWNQGVYSPKEMGGDPLHPIMSTPGRMYMVLAAKRLAALIAMIRDYDKDDVVTIVGHSQGCLIALLAQAFLLDMKGERPVDTLILTHPPYSLVDDTSLLFKSLDLAKSGGDPAMKGHYGAIFGRQTLEARLQTLARIVHGVADRKHSTPALETFSDQAKHHGMVGSKWTVAADRDNRGKVYLYFCPEDMTVALDNMQGIGWQGVPENALGSALSDIKKEEPFQLDDQFVTQWFIKNKAQQVFLALGNGFFQRVFTNKKRFDPVKKMLGPVLVGQPPHDFALHVSGEDDHAHVAASGRAHRAWLDEVDKVKVSKNVAQQDHILTEMEKREGLRRINGEALPIQVSADLRGTGQIDPKDIPKSSQQARLPVAEQGPCEAVDPIDAAIAVTSKWGLKTWQEMRSQPLDKQVPATELQKLEGVDLAKLSEQYNKEHHLGQLDKLDQRSVIEAERQRNGNVLTTVQESPNEARKRWQHEVSPKSFHGAIFGSSENHRNVTAYDMAIGGGKASSNPGFYAYLCAVADWRLQSNVTAPLRSSIMKWKDFVDDFFVYWNAEQPWRRDLIEGNATYYSSGNLHECVPSLQKGMPSSVVCETLKGVRTPSPFAPPEPKNGIPDGTIHSTRGGV